MMNYPGVIGADPQVIEKIVAAQAHHKKIDGHAPGLAGNDLNAYIAAGVYSDHECVQQEVPGRVVAGHLHRHDGVHALADGLPDVEVDVALFQQVAGVLVVAAEHAAVRVSARTPPTPLPNWSGASSS